MYEFLKPLFATDEEGVMVTLSYDQLVEKLGANKDLKIVNLSDGGYVSKDKLDSKIIELDGVKQQLSDANAQIASYKSMDIEGIKKSASDWEKKYNDDTAALTQKLKDQERAHGVDMFFNGYKFTSKAAQDGVRAAFDKRNFPYEDGKFIGAKEFMESLTADDDYKAAFVVEAPAPTEPTPAPPKPTFSDPTPTPTPKKKVSLTELMQRKNENPNTQIKYE